METTKILTRKFALPFSVISLAAILCSGCSFLGLHQDLAALEQTAEISGNVIAMPESEASVFVAVYKDQGEKQILHTYSIAYKSGEFSFLVPAGTYYLFAFEDKNEDATFQPDESIGWYGDPSPLTTGPGSASQGLVVTLHAPDEARAKLPQLYTLPTTDVPMEIKKRQMGTVVQLSDRRFGAEYASKGLWEPVKFLEEPGSGLFFLEPYDEQKIPVLFVHGAGGFPQQWGPIIQSLESSRFQPWILQYPSGLQLGLLGEFLEKYLVELQLKHRFSRLFIVAHSMGGLVSRSAVNYNTENRQGDFIRLLVTISTPWQGDPAAVYGVEHSPLVIPSWHDMASGSPFLKKLYETAMPSSVEFYLLFGYRGEAKKNGELSDGTVMLSSVLDHRISETAAKIYGFDEDHISILTSSAVMQRLNQLLDNAANKAADVTAMPTRYNIF